MNAAKSVRSLLTLITALVTGALVAGFMRIHAIAAEQETHGQANRDYVIKREVHGKLSVKLHEKFTIPVKDAAGGVAWSPDGSVLAVASGTGLATYSSSGHYLSGFDIHAVGGYLLSIAFVHDAKQILFPLFDSTKRGAALDVRDVETGKLISTLMGESFANEFSVSPDQKRVAFATFLGSQITTYDTQTWKRLSTMVIAEPKIGAVSLAFLPDNKQLAIGMGGWRNDKGIAMVAIADSSTGKFIKEFQVGDPNRDDGNVSAVAVSPKGDLLLTCMSSRIIHILRLSDGKQIAMLTDPGTGVTQGQAVWDPKGRFVAFVDRFSLIIWQPQMPGENCVRFKFSSQPITFFSVIAEKTVTMDTSGGFFLSLAITQDGNALAVTHGDSVTVFNIEGI